MKDTKRVFAVFFATVNGLGAANALAVDGVILIDQNKALAGAVTPGDAPGFPVTISQPGSYRLSGNLTVPNADTTAILITASHVTLDLNGFAILGPVTCDGLPVTSCTPANATGSGVATADASPSPSQITVRNGTVRGMGVRGVGLFGVGHSVENVRAESNGFGGILVEFGTLSNNIASRNGNYGVTFGVATVRHNTVMGNGVAGVRGGSGSISYNTAVQNGTGMSLGFEGGYTGNVMLSNNPSVIGGVSLGQNLCNGVLC